MNKVLYIGHYKENSGWGQVTRDYILAMDSVGINVVPRVVELANSVEPPTRLVELEQQSTHDCTICIQHVLPNLMQYNSKFKNIGIFELETQNIKHTSWVDNLNLMDEIWVPCTDMLHIDGVNIPIKLVPHAFDLEPYTKQYPTLDIPILKGSFVFYFIGEFNRRKHLGTLIRAFHTEFNPSEPVELVLKVNKSGIDSKTLANHMVEFCNTIKTNMNLYKDNRYKNEVIITVHIARDELLSLHQTCDCFVSTSYGEAWCLPGFEAMAMGNIVIAGTTGGPKDYIDPERTGMLVKGRLEPVFGQLDTVKEFGTSRETWFNMSCSDLMKTMRRAYELDKDKRARMSQEAKFHAKQYGYSKIGNKIKELLNV